MEDAREGRGLGPPEDDPELMARIRARDPEAFEEFVRRYEAFVHRVAARLLGADDDAVEEAAQEVFVRVWEKAAGFESKSKLSTWLYTLGVNVCRDRLRRSGKHKRIAQHLEEGEGRRRRPVPEPLAEITTREEQKEVDNALRQLSSDQREILVLKHAEGLSYPEISAILGGSVAALKMRASRAREALRKILAPGGGGKDQGGEA